ncbi:hypothetical protein BaRGS_00004877 [Batillaria attramentaria]|uniref:Uncharacterized protein n=1 Tax=Batillaria attramentaria TaxID=370345 RepID=A0ABD0LXI3_9CAEN
MAPMPKDDGFQLSKQDRSYRTLLTISVTVDKAACLVVQKTREFLEAWNDSPHNDCEGQQRGNLLTCEAHSFNTAVPKEHIRHHNRFRTSVFLKSNAAHYSPVVAPSISVFACCVCASLLASLKPIWPQTRAKRGPMKVSAPLFARATRLTTERTEREEGGTKRRVAEC